MCPVKDTCSLEGRNNCEKILKEWLEEIFPEYTERKLMEAEYLRERLPRNRYHGLQLTDDWSNITMNPLQVNNDGTTEWERKLEKTIQKWNDKMSEQCCEEKNNRIALRSLYKRRGGKHDI